MLDSLTSRGKAGAVLIAVGFLLLLAGMIGYTLTGEVEDVPTPNAPNQAFFADDPLPENILSPLFAAELTITWDRDDVWMGLVDADEKKRCEDVQATSSRQVLDAMERQQTSLPVIPVRSLAKDSVGTWSLEHTSQLSERRMVHYLPEQKWSCRMKFISAIPY